MKKMGTKCVSNGRNGDQTQREQRAENSLMAEIRDIESALYLVVSLANETTQGKEYPEKKFRFVWSSLDFCKFERIFSRATSVSCHFNQPSNYLTQFYYLHCNDTFTCYKSGKSRTIHFISLSLNARPPEISATNLRKQQQRHRKNQTTCEQMFKLQSNRI